MKNARGDECAYVVVVAHTSNVEEGTREIAIRKVHAIVDRPERSSERVTQAGETTARGRVRLEHDKGFAKLLRGE